MAVRLWLKDNVTGDVHEYGTNKHDSLELMEDGSLHYYNLQNGTGTMFPETGYSFCLKDGTVLNPNLEPDSATLDIGGDYHEEEISEEMKLLKKEFEYYFSDDFVE